MSIAAKPSPSAFKPSFDAAKALNAPLGIASPLWLAFAGAASAGVAFWWMTRWLRPANLEAVGTGEPALVAAPEPVIEASLEPALEAVEIVAEPAAETVVERLEAITDVPVVDTPAGPDAVAEAAPESIGPVAVLTVEAEPSLAPEPVVGPEPVAIEAQPGAAPKASTPVVVTKPKAKPATKASAAAAVKIVAPEAKAKAKAKAAKTATGAKTPAPVKTAKGSTTPRALKKAKKR